MSTLNEAEDKTEIHRLKSQLAKAAIQRLESDNLSKTEQKKLKAEVLGLCSDVQLGTMDLWFGDSVVTWGRLQLLDGQWREARSILLGQAEVLQNIEKNLVANQIPVSSISPLASCRYFLAETYRLEYEDNNQLEPAFEALKHYTNVYIKYGDSPWGELAEIKAERAKIFIESLGKKVRVELGSHRASFVLNKLKLGKRLTVKGDHEEALEPLMDAINIFPESSKSPEGLRNLSVCFLHLERDAEMRMTAEYLFERFSTYTNTPAVALGIGRQCLEADEIEAADWIFGRYLEMFPQDSHRADILSYFAWKAFKDGDQTEASRRFFALEAALRDKGEVGERLEKAVYIQASCSNQASAFDRFLSEFPESELVPRALSEKAQVLVVTGDFDAAFQTLEILSEQYPEAPSSRTALASLIVAAVDSERFDVADQVLDRMISDKDSYSESVYLSTGKALLHATQFELAEKAFSAVPLTAQKKFVEHALIGRAASWFGLKQFEKSLWALETLLTKYPSTGLFYDARLMQARAHVELGQNAEAIIAFSEVVSVQQDYSIVFEMAGIMTDLEERLAAYQRIALLANPDNLTDRPLIAESIVMSLPLCMEMKKYQVAIDSCDQFEIFFPEHDLLQSIVTYRREAEHAMAQ